MLARQQHLAHMARALSASALHAGTYKIPTANDIPLDLRVTLLRDAPCKRTPQAHSSKAVGEPPLFLGASVFFALKVPPPSYTRAQATHRDRKEKDSMSPFKNPSLCACGWPWHMCDIHR